MHTKRSPRYLVALCALALLSAPTSAQPSPTTAPATAAAPVGPTQPAADMHAVVPVIVPPPQPVIDPRTYGAKADGTTYDTAAIQKAIDACAGTGGTVYLAKGKFLSAELTLKGGMTFYVAKDATLLGGLEAQDYPVLVPEKTLATGNCRSLLYADKANALILDGAGVIDGRGKQVKMSGNETQRPSLLRIFHSDKVTVRNITLANPRMWTDVYSECNNLLIDRITVLSPKVNGQNLDGIDLCDCHDVIIRNSHIESQDDSICLKSYGMPGLKNILIENNAVLSSDADGIKFGTGTIGPMSNIRVLNNTVLGAKLGGLCIETVDGSAISDVAVDGLDIYRSSQPIFIRVGHRIGGPGELIEHSKVDTAPPGSISGVTIRRVRALGIRGPRASCTISGIPGAEPKDIMITDCYLEMPGGVKAIPADPGDRAGAYPQSNLFGDPPGWCFYIRHAHAIQFENMTIGRTHPDARPWLATEDAVVNVTALHELNQIAPSPVPPASSIGKSSGQ